MSGESKTSIEGPAAQGNERSHCERCALTLTEGADEPLAEGALVDGRYRIEARLGGGAMGDVYRARDVHLKRAVALKRPRFSPNADVRSLFEREAALLARMRSPNVATIHAFGTARGAPFFVMELIDGTTLDVLLERHVAHHSTLPLARSISIVREIANALSEAHALGIVHRDVKPTNVIVEHDSGRVVLVDFGVAVDAISAKPSKRVVGTLEYLAPEVLLGSPPTHASDQFALAVVAYELVTGVFPFSSSSVALMRPERRLPPPPSTLTPSAAAFDRVILRALGAEPRSRFLTIASFASALRDASMQSAPALSDRRDPSGVVDDAEGSLRVMVVEDDPVFVKLATRCVQVAFADVPVTVTRATSGGEALEKCARRLPQLILLDYRLPDGDGVELLARIRELPGGGSVRVVVVTSGVDEEAVLRFAALGVRRFARKPLDFEEVVELIGEVARTAGWLTQKP